MKILALLLVTIGMLPPVVASELDLAPEIAVTEEGGVYRVHARFEVPQSPDVALAVLKDYERIPLFMPDMRLSIVRARNGGRVVVEQEAQAKMMMFSKRVHLVLDIQEDGDALRFIDVSGRSFSHYSGQWHVAPLANGTAMSYDLSAKPAFSVPGFVLSRLMKRDATVMVERLRQEIAGRALVYAR